jgi:potassium/hydrogen antiporter
MGGEPLATAVILAAFGGLLAASVALSRVSARLGLPVALLFLLVGVLAGSEGIGHIAFEDYHFAFRVGTTALVLILFEGGLNTPFASAREVLAPSAVLATLGVVAIAGLVAGVAHLLGLSWPMAMLLGAIVSSTDAAAVFSVLSASGTRLRRRVGLTLEVESGLNDPMAVILTTTVTASIVSGSDLTLLGVTIDFLIEMVVGAAVGYGVARLGRLLILRVHLPAAGLYPAFTLAIACLSYGLTTILHGSGFLAVYVTGVTLGSGALPHAVGIRRVHDALGWLSQVLMFLLLGLLVFPARLWQVAGVGFALAIILAVVVRPLVAMLFLSAFRYQWRDSAFVGWVGLRGAVPIVLATFAQSEGIDESDTIFNAVFFVVLVSALAQGTTLEWVARRLGLVRHAPAALRPPIEVGAARGLNLVEHTVRPGEPPSGLHVRELGLPRQAIVAVIVRDGDSVPPRGSTVIEDGDQLFVLMRPALRDEVERLFESWRAG